MVGCIIAYDLPGKPAPWCSLYRPFGCPAPSLYINLIRYQAAIICRQPSNLVNLIALSRVNLPCRYCAIRQRNQPVDFSATLSKMKALGFVTSHTSENGTHNRPREITRSCVTVMEKLGQGAFGEVGSQVFQIHLPMVSPHLSRCNADTTWCLLSH